MEVEWWCLVSQPLHREDGGGGIDAGWRAKQCDAIIWLQRKWLSSKHHSASAFPCPDVEDFFHPPLPLSCRAPYTRSLFFVSPFPLADLWSNACVRCPEALDKLNQMSSACQEDVKKHRVTFAAVNIDDKVKARALVAER